MIPDDEKRIEGYLNGNQNAFFEISGWIETVVKNGYWGLNNDWADIIQDVRTKLYVNLKFDKFHFSSSLKTYVFRIAKYTCIDYLRKKYRSDKKEEAPDRKAEKSDQLASVIESEERQILRQILNTMKDQCRKILKMVFLEELPYRKIGAQLHIAEGTVKSRVSRCIQKAIQLRRRYYE